MRRGSLGVRRRTVVAVAGAVSIALLAGCASGGTDAGDTAAPEAPTEVIIAHPPGVSGDAIETLLAQFTKETGIKATGVPIADADLGSKVQLAARTGNSEWDVAMGITVDVYNITQPDGGYADIDTSGWDKADLKGMQDADLIGDDYTISQTAAALLVYSDKFADNPPTTWADFFDTTKYPGNRGMGAGGSTVPVDLEYAALASGVKPSKLYPLDVDRAIDEIKGLGSSLVLWDGAPKGIQDVVNGDTVMTWAFGPSAVSALGAQPVKIAVPDGTAVTKNVTVIMKSAPNGTAAGQAFLKWWYQAKIQAKYSELTGYGIVVPSKPILDLIPPDKATYLPYAGKFGDAYRDLDYDFYGKTGDDGQTNLAKILNAWNEFRAG